jgi:hypothetical protein
MAPERVRLGALRATRRRNLLRIVCCVLCLIAVGCAARRGTTHPALRRAVDQRDPLTVADSLEALIAAGIDTPADRQFAYEALAENHDDTASAAYARASVAGRLVQQKGLLGSGLIADVERDASRSRELDPSFRDGAATRMLGTLYVLAPASFLQRGDSEEGIVLLEGLVETYPYIPENHLRLAEAYIALGDPAPALPHLCRCLDVRATLRRDEQLLLAELIASVGTLDCRAAAPVIH